ncbi:MAG TPA: phosphatidate cytidylyltransferase [Bacillales bacterium]|nr:phosphatidate cytidylyltransferase [Bacillales bacterium]
MKQRIITGLSAGIFFLFLAFIGGVAFVMLAVVMASVGYMEFLRMKKISPFSFPGIVGLIAVILMVPHVRFALLPPLQMLLIALLLLLAFTVLSKNMFHFDKSAFIILSVLYVGFGFHFLVEARVLDNGLNVLFFILLAIWSTDSGAYFAGRAVGKRKLWPDISPNKTIEGALGGIAAALAVAVLYEWFFPVYESIWASVAAGLVIAIFGQLGDLIESAFKRHYGVKDSGAILPGHGGILDRCDSWLLVFPVLHLFHFI